MANHAVVYARTIVGDQDFGVKPFFMQIRDMENHMPLKGIQAGDLGSKLGYNSENNGWM